MVPSQPGRFHIFLVALHERDAPHRPRILHPIGKADGEHQDPELAALDPVVLENRQHNAVDQQRRQDGRKGELDVGNAHDEAVNAAAGIAGAQAQREAYGHRQQHRGDADQ
jgi:hypothetical protein